MKNPQVGQLVWAEKLIGTFTVIAVHTDHGFADLQSADGKNTFEKHVPFALIHALGGDHSPTSRD
ncbi:MAG: hypothetical protein WB524_08515 [Acidobacteriaceae bacterium]|jgi:hypothetical protein